MECGGSDAAIQKAWSRHPTLFQQAASFLGALGVLAVKVSNVNEQTLAVWIFKLWILWFDSFQFDEAAQFRNHHALDHFLAAGEDRFVAGPILSFAVVPDLAIGAFAVPAEISVGNGFD